MLGVFLTELRASRCTVLDQARIHYYPSRFRFLGNVQHLLVLLVHVKMLSQRLVNSIELHLCPGNYLLVVDIG